MRTSCCRRWAVGFISYSPRLAGGSRRHSSRSEHARFPPASRGLYDSSADIHPAEEARVEWRNFVHHLQRCAVEGADAALAAGPAADDDVELAVAVAVHEHDAGALRLREDAG